MTTYTAWRATFQSSEQAAQSAWQTALGLQRQLESIGAGGVEPLRKPACTGCPVQARTHAPSCAIHQIVDAETQGQPEALRLAGYLRRAIVQQHPESNGIEKAASVLEQQHANIAELEAELVKEAARTADYKLRAEQMEQRLDMANKLGNEARAELAALKAAPAAQAVEPVREQFERAYATEWASSRGGNETPEQLAQEVKGWRDGESYPADMPYLKHTWDGFQWAAALRATPPAPAAVAVPDGWKLVPANPTAEMCHVGRYGGDKDAPTYGEQPVEGVTAWPFVADHTAEKIYRAMLAAAPALAATPAAQAGEAIAEITSANHDAAAFGERGFRILRDFQHMDYGTKLYAHPAPQAQDVQEAGDCFELWWADQMPSATQVEAHTAWTERRAAIAASAKGGAS